MTLTSPEMITSAGSVIVQADDRQALLSFMYIEANSRKSKKNMSKIKLWKFSIMNYESQTQEARNMMNGVFNI